MRKHKPDETLKIGIIIPTMNRSEFVIRQLSYYSSVNCPHTIYIGDSSDLEHTNKIKTLIDSLSDIKVVYKYIPSLNDREANKYLLSIVEEPYVCFIGDDDYQIPDSLTKCAEFLENNPDYATASGYAVSFRLKEHGAYGELKRLADYPRHHLDFDAADERILGFFKQYCVTLFSVNRTPQMLKNFEKADIVKDKSFGSELIPCTLSIIAGKSATLDCLSLVRQIHDSHYFLPDMFDWITGPEWKESYEIFKEEVSKNITIKDQIPIESADKITKQAFWSYLQKYLSKEYYQHYSDQKNDISSKKFLISTRHKITKALPSLKYIYRTHIKPKFTGKKELNFEVLQPGSKYYKDFKPVMDSFTDTKRIDRKS